MMPLLLYTDKEQVVRCYPESESDGDGTSCTGDRWRHDLMMLWLD
jgi:hypothetical protein